jgi:LuxR family maltose regulon positive regulatory protein
VPVLATKLYISPPPPKAVQRSRLVERLNAGLHRKITLIAAPAGYGKTTLLSAWVAGLQVSGTHVAWLSLDEGDSDPARFVTYLIAALRTVAPNIGEDALGLLQSHSSSQPQPAETILTALLNEITTIPHNLVLVLDDYHVVDAPAVDAILTFLIEHMPAQMHLVITSRDDPPLPLARLRVRDQLTELRASDLRFTPTEAAAFLQAMNLNLSAGDVAALEDRTEGWIAGLQLASLSMQGHHDISGFIRAFAGDHRYIADYLVEEVLQRQPENVRSFLLQTSILERLNGPLCDAVTGQEEGHARLVALERGNFLVVPLDDKRRWYRYHHLFAEVLQAHLMAEQPDLVPTLHRLASRWYEQNHSAADAVPQAIRHAMSAEDFNRAADLVERAVPVMRPSRQEAALLGWLKALPDEVIRCRPVLSVAYAEVLLGIGELEGVEDRVRDAERWLDQSVDTADMADMRARPDAPPAGMVIADGEAFRRLPAEIAVARAGLALMLGDGVNAVKYAQRVLDLVPEGEELGAGSGAALLGLAAWASGDLEAAHRTFAEGMAHLQRAGYVSDAIGGSVALADIRIAQGRLREALRTYERGLQLATVQGGPILRGAADMHVGMSALYREHNDLEAATQHLRESKQLGEHNGFPQNGYRWRVAMARIREAQGDVNGALDLIQEAEGLYVRDFFPNVRPVAALKTRVWVSQGALDDVLGWARAAGLSADDDLSYLREFEHITLARVLLARYKSEKSESAERSILEAIGLLERLLKEAEEGGRTGSVIEILVLQSLAHHAQGDTHAALMPLQRALTLAEPEGYVRMFVDEGSSMAQLLQEAVSRRMMPEYAGKLLVALGNEQQESTGESPLPTLPTLPYSPTSSTSKSLTEPLSQRELEVLRLFQTELTGPEIASELVIALSTLRSHTKGIYSKLNVNTRRAAVKRAAELGLI